MYTKEDLERIVYELHEASSFLLKSTWWSSPTVGFSYNQTRLSKLMDALMKEGLIKEKRSDVICVLCDWETVAEGIFMTDQALYVNSPKNSDKRFRVAYSTIKRLDYNRSAPSLKITTHSNTIYRIDTPIWSKRNIYLFLQIATGITDFDEEDKERLANVTLPSRSEGSSGATAAGIVFGNVSNASTVYGQDKFLNAKSGHGYAAERANHIVDKLSGKKTTFVGDGNATHGPDRIVDGVAVQTKYWDTGAKCVEKCFENGQMKYMTPDGPMQIEVPADKYDSAVQAMERRILNGEVPGVTDPAEAKNIIRKGHFTYEQAKNIARFGTVESIVYDAANGAVISTYAFGISAAISFAVSVWNGEDFNTALKAATHVGLKVGGTTFVTAVLASQLSRTGLNSMLVGSSEAIVRVMGPKASELLVNAFRNGANIYGAAAMKSAAKLLRTNAITAGVSFVVLSSVDVVNIFRGRISGAQLFKNLTNTAATVGGGTAGWVGGAAAGAAIGSAVPIVGTAVGGIVGGLVGAFTGGSLAGKASEAVLGAFIEDDATEMTRIIEARFQQLAEDYLLSRTEAENIVEALTENITGGTLKDMFASSDRVVFANNLLVPYIEDEVKKRKHVRLPDEQQMIEGLRWVLEEVADANAALA